MSRIFKRLMAPDLLRTVLPRKTEMRRATILPIFKTERASKFMECSTRQDNSSAIVMLPGLRLADMDRSMQVAPWNLAKLGDESRMICLGWMTTKENNNMNFLDWKNSTGEVLTFTVSLSFYIERALYHPTNYFQPLQNDIKLLRLGTTSYTDLNELKLRHCQTLLSRSIYNIVTVDPITHRPVALPEAWYRRFTMHQTPPDINERKVTALVVPETAFEYRSKVEYSDLDYYGHTNHCSYICMVLNGANAASHEDCFSMFFGDLAYKQLKEMHVLYQGETRIGDEIVTKVWENKDDPFTIHTVLCKDDLPMFTSTFTYYD